jgi:hypothetical protein
MGRQFPDAKNQCKTYASNPGHAFGYLRQAWLDGLRLPQPYARQGQVSPMLRGAVTEAIQRQPAGSRPRPVKDAIIARHDKQAKKIAAARELLTLGRGC